jgi:hypothetical protein
VAAGIVGLVAGTIVLPKVDSAGEGVIYKGEIRVEQTAPRVVVCASVGYLKTFASIVGSGMKVR